MGIQDSSHDHSATPATSAVTRRVPAALVPCLFSLFSFTVTVRTVNPLRALLKAHKLSFNGTKAILEERCRANGIDMGVPIAFLPSQAAAPPPVHAPPVPETTNFDPPAFQQAQPVAVAAVDTRPAHNAPPTEPVSLDSARRLSPTQPVSGAVLVDAAASIRSPDFTEHETVRLAHVLCEGEVAAGVLISRATMSREQMDAKKSPGEVWVVVLGDMFNSDRTFSAPAACSDLDIDPNAHPHARTGKVLKAKWNEVCCATLDAVLVVDESTNGYGPIVSSRSEHTVHRPGADN